MPVRNTRLSLSDELHPSLIEVAPSGGTAPIALAAAGNYIIPVILLSCLEFDRAP